MYSAMIPPLSSARTKDVPLTPIGSPLRQAPPAVTRKGGPNPITLEAVAPVSVMTMVFFPLPRLTRKGPRGRLGCWVHLLAVLPQWELRGSMPVGRYVLAVLTMKLRGDRANLLFRCKNGVGFHRVVSHRHRCLGPNPTALGECEQGRALGLHRLKRGLLDRLGFGLLAFLGERLDGFPLVLVLGLHVALDFILRRKRAGHAGRQPHTLVERPLWSLRMQQTHRVALLHLMHRRPREHRLAD